MQKNILNLFLFFSIFFYDLAFSFDFNKDGYEDIVFSNNRLNGSYYTDSFIYFGSDLGYSENNKIKLPAIGPHGNTVADINKDGYDDIIFCNYTDGSSYELFSYIYYGNSSGFKGYNLENIPTSGAMGCAVADLNFDGFNDLVFSNYRDNSSRATSSYIYYGSPNGFSTNYRTSLPTIGARGGSIADLNGDSYFDILFSNNNNGYDSRLNSVIFFW